MARSFSGSLVPCSPLWPSRAKKTITVHIQTLDVDMEFSVPYRATGKEVFDKAANTIGLRETWFFGLQLANQSTQATSTEMWIDESKRIIDQINLPSDNKPVQFYLLVKFYPVKISDLIQDITRHLFYLQVKDQILSRIIYAPANVCVMLASYALQAKFGDYNPTKHKVGQLGDEPLIPKEIMKKYELPNEGWEENVLAWYAEHSREPNLERDKEWAELQYLEVAQNSLSMFGMNYFLIQNKKNANLWLGVDADGLSVFEMDNQEKPVIAFPWNEVTNISFSDKKFIIKPVNASSDDYKFYTQKIRTNRMILQMCMGYYDLYTRRLKGDTLIVQALKQQAKEERKRKLMEREKLDIERRAKEEAIKQKEQLVRRFEAQSRKANDKLQRKKEIVEGLEEKHKIAEEQANFLAKKATEARLETQRYKGENLKSLEENQMLKRLLREREEAAQSAASSAECGALEAYRLRKELDTARTRETAARTKLLEITNQSFNTSEEVDLSSYLNRNNSLSSPNGSTSSGIDAALGGGGGDLAGRVENARLEEAKRSEEFETQLQSLKDKLEEVRVDKSDPIEIVDEDKYQTLRRITAGDTPSRIAFFQSL